MDNTEISYKNTTNKKNGMIVKKSTGIIIFSRDFNKVLLVRKRYTYEYFDFVIGKYSRTNKQYILKLLNNMTVSEKLIILSLNFENMWYNIFLNTEKSNDYYKSYTKFYNAYLINDNSKTLKSLIYNSSSGGELLWEPPKGRKKTKESNINCAIREVSEETKISPDLYKLLPNFKYKRSIIENNIKYNIMYYVARYKYTHINTNLHLGSNLQVGEIDRIKVISTKYLNSINICNDIKKFISFVQHKNNIFSKKNQVEQ